MRQMHRLDPGPIVDDLDLHTFRLPAGGIVESQGRAYRDHRTLAPLGNHITGIRHQVAHDFLKGEAVPGRRRQRRSQVQLHPDLRPSQVMLEHADHGDNAFVHVAARPDLEGRSREF